MKQATLTFLTHHLASKQELADLTRAFKEMDANGNGTLSKEEMMQAYKMLMGEAFNVAEVERIMDLADTDGSGEINYNEWVVATINRSSMLEQEKLEKAF